MHWALLELGQPCLRANHVFYLVNHIIGTNLALT